MGSRSMLGRTRQPHAVPGQMWEQGRQLNLERSALSWGMNWAGYRHRPCPIRRVLCLLGASRKAGSLAMSRIRARRRNVAPSFAEKGSITVNGVSATVNDVATGLMAPGDIASIIIPHTAE